ncbi:MAG: hypothetical protein Ct9H90mP20_2790 [Candidatus Neomarinimicrobiota bacterium]|nr:MAG: hypothetical protein Ct9H90mP20_2790 [Candidatus Neomarinimicrobiota bacterium]
MELFYSTGMRLSELINLNINSLDAKKHLIKVFGKGSKERLIPFGKRAKFSIENYLKIRGLSLNSRLKRHLYLLIITKSALAKEPFKEKLEII